MKLIDFDDTEKLKRLEDTTDADSMPRPGNHPVKVEVYRIMGTEDHYHLVRGTKQYRRVTHRGPDAWTELDG